VLGARRGYTTCLALIGEPSEGTAVEIVGKRIKEVYGDSSQEDAEGQWTLAIYVATG
jgi:hypothetical protein